MALPDGITTLTLTGSYVAPDGTPLGGQVSFAPSSPLTDPDGMLVIAETQLAVRLQAGTGSFSIVLACTDNADLLPAGWQWRAIIQVPGAEGSFYFDLPSTLGPTHDISALTPHAGAPAASGSYVSSIDGQTGDVVLADGFGILPPAGDLGGTTLSPHVTATHLAAPLPIVQGGTGAASGSAALAALGGISAVSPAFTGTPTAPTATALTDSTQLATTAYADSAVAAEASRAGTAEGLKLAKASNLSDLASASTALANLGAQSGPVVTRVADFVHVGDPDFTAGINRALAAAPSGSVVQLPPGTVGISGSGITPQGTDVELRGWGNATVVQPTGSMSSMIQTSSSTAGARFRLSSVLVDGLFQATTLLGYSGSSVQGLTCTNVTFRNPGTLAVNLTAATGVDFDHCRFTGNSQTGRPNGTMAELFSGSRRIKFSWCEFESYVNGIIGASGSLPYDSMIDDVEIDHCYFNGSWWLIPAGTPAQVGTPSGSGGGVTYTSTTLTDTGAAFATMAQPGAFANNVRAMPVRHTGTITTAGQLALTDSAANFGAALTYGSATRGDIVRTASAWAMVEGIESSGTTLRVSQWRSLTTWQVVAAPAVSTAYTLYAVILANVMSYTGTAITVDRWHDWLGTTVTPPSGTLYEVMTTRPSYAVNFNPGTWNVRVTHSEFFGNWSDQCSVFAQEAQITGNYIHDGQDGGITLAQGDRHVVTGNRIRHQGSTCMFFFGSQSSITGNAFQGAGWVNQNVGEVSASCQTTTFTGNTFTSDSGISGIASQNYGLHLSNSQGANSGNYVSADNIFSGHAVADIWLDGPTGTFGPNEIHAQSGTVVGYNGATPGQRLSYSGTGIPSLPAAVGSTYTQTDATTGGPGWTYTSSGWAQGMSGGTVPGNLTVGGSLTSFGGYASASLATPTGLAVTPTGTTGSATYGYRIAAVAGTSATAPCAEVQTTTGNATLSGANFNALTWTAVTNALAYNVYGRTHNGESLLAQVAGTTYNDTGAATPAAARNLLTGTTVTPSFAAGSTNGWAANGGHGTLSNDATTGPNANNCSLKVVTDGTSSAGAITSASSGPVPLSSASPYTLSFYAKGSGTLSAFLSSSPAFAAFASTTTIALTTTWTRYSITGTCTASQTHLFASFTCATSTTFWISAIQMEQASAATTYIDLTTTIAMPATGSQLLAQAWPSQTGAPLVAEDSSGNVLFQADPSGNALAKASLTAPVVAASGLTGAATGSRLVGGGTTTGAPASGTFAANDIYTDSGGTVWVCTVAGTPGTWVASGVTLDSTAGDIKPAGTAAAAGASGKAADASHVHLQSFSGIFGNGSDGSATLDGTATVAWASKSGSVYTMSRDCFCTNLTVNSGVTLSTAGTRIFCAGIFSNAGTVQNPGNSASGATGGAAGTSVGLTAVNAGGNGATGNGAAGGAAGGRAGAGTSGNGGAGAGGTAGSQGGSGGAIFPIYVPYSVTSGTYASGGVSRLVSGAGGAGGGGGDSTNAGGGGGAGGGIIAIFAWSAVNTGTISAAGGNGATPATGNCGGGGAGGGGVIAVYTLAAWTAGTTSVAAGTAGSGVGTGAAGAAASAGTVLNLILA